MSKWQVFFQVKKKLKIGRIGYLSCLYSIYQKHQFIAKRELLNPLLCQQAIVTLKYLTVKAVFAEAQEALTHAN